MKWYCIYTHPLKEAVVTNYLTRNLGFECYFPKLVQRVTIRRVKRVVTRPLFPRYLFCRFEAGVSYRSIRYASEVVNVVNFGGKPIEVSDSIIAGLRLRASPSGAGDEILSDPPLRPGTKLLIVNGVMRGLEGLFLRPMDDSERVAILLSTLNASVVVERSHCKVMDTAPTPFRGMASAFAGR